MFIFHRMLLVGLGTHSNTLYTQELQTEKGSIGLITKGLMRLGLTQFPAGNYVAKVLNSTNKLWILAIGHIGMMSHAWFGVRSDGILLQDILRQFGIKSRYLWVQNQSRSLEGRLAAMCAVEVKGDRGF